MTETDRQRRSDTGRHTEMNREKESRTKKAKEFDIDREMNRKSKRGFQSQKDLFENFKLQPAIFPFLNTSFVFTNYQPIQRNASYNRAVRIMHI